MPWRTTGHHYQERRYRTNFEAIELYANSQLGCLFDGDWHTPKAADPELFPAEVLNWLEQDSRREFWKTLTGGELNLDTLPVLKQLKNSDVSCYDEACQPHRSRLPMAKESVLLHRGLAVVHPLAIDGKLGWAWYTRKYRGVDRSYVDAKSTSLKWLKQSEIWEERSSIITMSMSGDYVEFLRAGR